jgi:hypothetical protein
MNKTAFLALIAWTLIAASAVASPPRGTLLELHSCELYAGGCVVSSEATLDGRYMLRAWNFIGGSFSGADFAGLQVAVLQSADDNLAAESTSSDNAIVYLPENASSVHREALLTWVKSTLPDLKSAGLKSRIAPLNFSSTSAGYTFSAGDSIVVKTASLESCEVGACGESLWYTPRSPSNVYTVAVNRSAKISEPLLQLNWNEGGKRSVFLGRFGERNAPKNLHVTAADLCGPADRLF